MFLIFKFCIFKHSLRLWSYLLNGLDITVATNPTNRDGTSGELILTSTSDHHTYIYTGIVLIRFILFCIVTYIF